MYKYELHAHTSECDLCAHLSGRELVRLYKDAGYDGMVITDHYFRLFYADWFSEELKDLTHQQQIARWLKGFREAREEGGIMTEHRIQTPEELSATLRSGKYRLIENY